METQKAIDPKIIERITKLLALAKDGNAFENEADVAMAKAQEIAKLNNLSIAEIESEGKKAEGGARAEEETKKKAVFEWQRNLMMALCEVNYCYCSVIYGKARDLSVRDEKGKVIDPDSDEFKARHPYYYHSPRKTIPKGYRIIGRESNVVTVKVMFDYLLKTIGRITHEEAGHNMSREAKSFKEGCSDRLVERIKKRHLEALRAQEEEVQRKRKEAQARANHPGAAPNSPGTALVISLIDYAQRELDLNNDYKQGWEPGTTERKRKEGEALRQAEKNKALSAGIDDAALLEEIMDWIDAGYSFERSKELAERSRKSREAAAEKTNPKEETEAQRRKRMDRERRENERWQRRYYRKQEKRDWGAYRRGQEAGEKIGLDQQIEKGTRQTKLK
jgi:hypothetical protein